ncbi:hypothetical protein AVEN_60303-1, partial [Araneus ventricosus]
MCRLISNWGTDYPGPLSPGIKLPFSTTIALSPLCHENRISVPCGLPTSRQYMDFFGVRFIFNCSTVALLDWVFLGLSEEFTAVNLCSVLTLDECLT